jgi:hypothetical protein
VEGVGVGVDVDVNEEEEEEDMWRSIRSEDMVVDTEQGMNDTL